MTTSPGFDLPGNIPTILYSSRAYHEGLPRNSKESGELSAYTRSTSCCKPDEAKENFSGRTLVPFCCFWFVQRSKEELSPLNFFRMSSVKHVSSCITLKSGSFLAV